jgi:DNA uptake protein ComE-like DNA-binding protein
MMSRIKDYFTFNRKEQRGLIALLALLLCSVIGNIFLPYLIKEEYYDTEPYRENIESFISKMKEHDSLKRINKPSDQKYYTKDNSAFRETFRISPFFFDPNTLTAAEWDKMGMPQAISRNILRYVEKGGKFRKNEDLKKIFGMTDSIFHILTPYIRIETIQKQTYSFDKDKHDSKNEILQEISDKTNPVPIQVNINAADSSSLLALPGVGPYFANKIMKYRDQLGGFVSPMQLLEIKGMDSLRLHGFINEVLIDSTLIRKIDLNAVTFKELLKHPYFEYYLVKAIFNYKDQIHNYDSISQLKNIAVMYPELYDRISPYLKISEGQTE